MTFEEVWQGYRARIRAFLHVKVANPADVDDLLQEISIKVFRGLPSIKDSEKVQSWLFQVAHRTVIDFYRKSSKERDIGANDLWYSEDNLDTQKDLERCITPFLGTLKPEAAAMLMAIDIDGISQKDFAQAKGIPYSTLKSRLQRARSNLKQLYENCCRLSLDAYGNIIDYHHKSSRCEKC